MSVLIKAVTKEIVLKIQITIIEVKRKTLNIKQFFFRIKGLPFILKCIEFV